MDVFVEPDPIEELVIKPEDTVKAQRLFAQLLEICKEEKSDDGTIERLLKYLAYSMARIRLEHQKEIEALEQRVDVLRNDIDNTEWNLPEQAAAFNRGKIP